MSTLARCVAIFEVVHGRQYEIVQIPTIAFEAFQKIAVFPSDNGAASKCQPGRLQDHSVRETSRAISRILEANFFAFLTCAPLVRGGRFAEGFEASWPFVLLSGAKRTCTVHRVMSAKCQKRTHALQQFLFDSSARASSRREHALLIPLLRALAIQSMINAVC